MITHTELVWSTPCIIYIFVIIYLLQLFESVVYNSALFVFQSFEWAGTCNQNQQTFFFSKNRRGENSLKLWKTWLKKRLFVLLQNETQEDVFLTNLFFVCPNAMFYVRDSVRKSNIWKILLDFYLFNFNIHLAHDKYQQTRFLYIFHHKLWT